MCGCGGLGEAALERPHIIGPEAARSPGFPATLAVA